MDTNNSENDRPLVQAPMESPLNLAHTFSRRADMLAKSRKYEEAITCHRKAAECLLQAMKNTTSKTLLESMALQHKVCLSQIDRLHAKNQLLELMDRNNKTTATISRATQTDDLNSIDTTEQQVVLDEDMICQTLRENDDLVNRICLRNSEKSDTSQASFVSYKSCSLSEGEAMDIVNTDKALGVSKLLRNDGEPLGEDRIEELVKMNEKLSQAVRSLLQELGSTKAEKKQMEEKLGDSQEMLKQGSEGALKFSSLDLPPLEMSYPELGKQLQY